MDNFFSNALDFNYFKKALKITDGESIIINISSTDSSLVSKPKYDSNPQNKQRKSMSDKFEPSPFGRFFGSQKRNTAPVDMNDFTSWKNKNYRRKEEQFDMDDDDFSSFSLAKYMKDNSGDKFNELDQAKTELQKPIGQLASDDPTLKKFSLDSYMHKLEESILAKDKFAENEDLLEPIVSSNDEPSSDYNYNQSAFGGVVKTINKYQDEDFSFGGSNIEKFAFGDEDDEISGNDFSLDQSEFDKLKKRLDKIERQAKKTTTSSKPTQRLLIDDGIFDEPQKINPETADFDSLILKDSDNIEIGTVSDMQSAEQHMHGKKLSEVVVNTDQSSGKTKMPLLFSESEPDEAETTQSIVQPKTFTKKTETVEEPSYVDSFDEEFDTNEEPEEEMVSIDTLKKSDLITKDNLKEITEEFMAKFAEIYKINNPYAQQPYQDPYTGQTVYPDQNQDYSANPYAQQDYNRAELEEYKNNQNKLQEKLLELVEEKNKSEKETRERLKSIEDEKRRMDEEYQNRLREMEENYNKKYEEFKQKIILDTNSHNQKLRETEEKIKAVKFEAQQDLQLRNSTNVGIVLGKELKSYYIISNLEMDKKLIEISARLESGESARAGDNGLRQHISRSSIEKKAFIQNLNTDEIKEELNEIAQAELDAQEDSAEVAETLNAVESVETEETVKTEELETSEELDSVEGNEQLEETKSVEETSELSESAESDEASDVDNITAENFENSENTEEKTDEEKPNKPVSRSTTPRKRKKTRKIDRDITGDISF